MVRYSTKMIFAVLDVSLIMGLNIGDTDKVFCINCSNGEQLMLQGDFVDRGYYSLETFTLLMCLKARFDVYKLATQHTSLNLSFHVSDFSCTVFCSTQRADTAFCST